MALKQLVTAISRASLEDIDTLNSIKSLLPEKIKSLETLRRQNLLLEKKAEADLKKEENAAKKKAETERKKAEKKAETERKKQEKSVETERKKAEKAAETERKKAEKQAQKLAEKQLADSYKKYVDFFKTEDIDADELEQSGSITKWHKNSWSNLTQEQKLDGIWNS